MVSAIQILDTIKDNVKRLYHFQSPRVIFNGHQYIFYAVCNPRADGTGIQLVDC